MPDTTETVTLTREKYEAMARSVRFLRALHNAGLEEWCNYDIALDLFGDEDED